MFRPHFFIDRPVLASVISLLIVLAGFLAILDLPVDRYPQIVPPSVTISASYPGADAQTVAESVAEPIEQRLSAIPNLLYFTSQAGNDGSLSIRAVFEVGTNEDVAAVDVQNRLSGAYSRLPEEVIRRGIEVSKSSSSMLAMVALNSSDPRYDDVFLSNYAIVNILNAIRREPGVGNVSIFGSRTYSMRIWVNPDQLTRIGMTMSEVAAIIRDQNNLYPTGTIAQRPTDDLVELTIPVQTDAGLTDPEQYERIILRSFPDGRTIRLGDIARVELGSASYDRVGRVNNRPTALLMISKQTNANALETIANVRRGMDELALSFPEGVTYAIPYDTTTFISQSISEVVKTLIEATLLVILVVFLFLQSWRATLIPLVAVPVSVIGAFAGMHLLGFSINTLTLFGLVLAIGIVVDDAIVVVENVERLMEQEGLSARDATIKAMRQVSGALVAMVLVLCAVFVPVSVMGGLTGQLYRQFAVTIAVSVAISGVVALTLSPALCRMVLRPRGDRRELKVFTGFNRRFESLTGQYTNGVRFAIARWPVTLLIFICIGVLSYRLSDRTPSAFLPTEDQGFFTAAVLLPDGASLDRTDVLLSQVESVLSAHPAVENVIALLGQDSLSGGTISSNAGTLFVSLRPFEERTEAGLNVQSVIDSITEAFADSREGLVLAFHPPAVQGLGQRAGFQLELQDRGSGDLSQLVAAASDFVDRATAYPELESITSSTRFSSPRLFVEVDRERTRMLDLELSDVYGVLQSYLGTIYVNDFSMFGRVWRVNMQSEPSYRDSPDDLNNYLVRNSHGVMIPLSFVVNAEFRAGPNLLERFNGFPSVQISGAPSEGVSTGEAMRLLEQLASETLPAQYGIEWSGSSFEERRAGGQAQAIILFGVLVVFLVLAALYERWIMPLGVILVVPVAVFGAFLAIFLRGLPQDVYFQIGTLVLVGLAAKNAILLVEFCIDLQREGLSTVDAAIEAAKIRFRPILMTSLAFIAGVIPLMIASGAGAASRHSIGTGVAGGMLATTLIAPFLVPALFVLIEIISGRYVSSNSIASDPRP